MSSASAVPGGSNKCDSFGSPHDGLQVSASAEGSERVGFHESSSVCSSNSSAPLKVPKASGVTGLERWRGLGESEGKGEGVSEIGELGGLLSEEDRGFSGSSDVEAENWGSWAGTVLSGMVSNVECAGCHVEDGSFLQSDASVRLASSQRGVASTDHDRVEMSSSWSP